VFYLFNQKEFFETAWLEKIILFADEEAGQFVQFTIWDALYKRNSNQELKNHIEDLILDLESRHSHELNPADVDNLTLRIIRLLTDYYQNRNLDLNPFATAFYNLKKFYLKGKYQARHFLLIDQLNGYDQKSAFKSDLFF
jgi:hypothetical protein